MAEDKVDTIRSSSGTTVGRAVSEARGQRLTLDSSSRPQPDAMTNSEAFLAGISSCGVTLIEGHARQAGIPLGRTEVTIEGTRLGSDPTRFARIHMRFRLAGVTQPQAEDLVRTYHGH
jgi:uncharacterized OsmC-like protein